MSHSLHAGFLLRGIRVVALASRRFDRVQLDAAWSRCCVSEVTANFDLSLSKLPDDPVLLAAANILCRGLPTLPSLEMEKRMSIQFGRTVLAEDHRGRIFSQPGTQDPAFGSRIVDALLAGVPPSTAGRNARIAAMGDVSLLTTEEGREALQLVLSPIGAARIARTLLGAVLGGGLDLSARVWKIGVIERDVPCTALGIGEFTRLLSMMFILEGAGRTLPQMQTWVVPSTAFAASPLHSADGVSLLKDGASLLKEGARLPDCDLLLDIAVLQAGKDSFPPIEATAPRQVTLRTAATAAAAAASAAAKTEEAPTSSSSAPRRFLFGDYRPYAGLRSKETSSMDPAMLGALKAFIAHCFRITRPSQEQLDLLDLVLQHRSFLAALPAGAGKTVVFHAAALLYPALSVAVLPLASLVDDQYEQLRDVFIDATLCLHEGMGIEERQAAREAFADRQGLLMTMSADVFRNEDVDAMLQRLRADRLPFAQCVVDEAHVMSEWSHDFRMGMHGAPAFFGGRLEGGKKHKVACRLFTASAGRDVVTDLRAQLSDAGAGWSLPEAQVLLVQAGARPQQHFSCERVARGTASAPAALLERQKMLPDLLRRLPRAVAELGAADPGAADPGAVSPTVVYAPFAAGLLGVTNRYDPGETDDALDQTLEDAGLPPALFIGKEDGQSRVGRQLIIDSAVQRRRFRDGAHPLLLATTAYGIGTHKADIRATVHLLPPASVERLLQECGRGGHDGKPVLHTILYGGEADDTTSPDLLPGFLHPSDAYRVTGYAHLAALAGDASREKQITHDLLREIAYPEDANTNRISAVITAEFGFDVRVSYWQRNLDERMYIHHGSVVMGYVDLVSQALTIDNGYKDRDIAERVLRFAHRFSLEEAGSEHGLSSWVAATFPSDVDDGLVRQLEDFEPGAEFTLRLGFENDRESLLTQVHQLLWRQAEIEIPRKLLSGIQASNWPVFRRELCMRADNDSLLDGIDGEIEKRLQRAYNRIRLREDTERFILRLQTLGLLRHYVVHPTARKFSLRIVARAEHEIRDALERTLSRHMPAPQARMLVAKAETYPGDTILERALFLLIDQRVQSRRESSESRARTMLRLYALGTAKGSDAFRVAVTTAEAARFALPWHLPTLLPRSTDRLRLFSEVLSLLEQVKDGSLLENAAHLGASCKQLSTSFPDEPALELLRSFSGLLLVDAKGRKEERQKFARAFALAAAASGLEGERYREAVDAREAMLRRLFGDDETPFLLGLLHDEVKRVKTLPLPAPVPRTVHDAKSATQKAATQKAATQKAVAEKAAAQKAAAQKAAAHKAAAQKAAVEKAAAQKAAAEKAAAQKAEAERRRERDSEARPADPDRSEAAPKDTILTELEQMLSELDTTTNAAVTGAAQRQARRASVAAGAPPVPTGEADPEVLRHLDWLKAFNNNFLKQYES